MICKATCCIDDQVKPHRSLDPWGFLQGWQIADYLASEVTFWSQWHLNLLLLLTNRRAHNSKVVIRIQNCNLIASKLTFSDEDHPDSKSGVRKDVGVRLPPSARNEFSTGNDPAWGIFLITSTSSPNRKLLQTTAKNRTDCRIRNRIRV